MTIGRDDETEASAPLAAVAAAIAQGSLLHAAACVQRYARRSRANGDSVQDVVKRLMDVLRDATDDELLAKRSSQVATWAIDAYFDETGAGSAGLAGAERSMAPARLEPMQRSRSTTWR